MLMEILLKILLCLLISSNDEIVVYVSGTLYATHISEGDGCRMKSGEPGICTIVTQCQPIISALKSGQMSLDDMVRCSFIRSEEVVCCPDGFKPTEITPFTTSTSSSSTRSTTTTATFVQPTSDLPRVDIRGTRPAAEACRRLRAELVPQLTQHILDGIPVEPGEFPHMAALGYPRIEDEINYSFDCGGTLISDKFVLTAAHCISDGRRRPAIVRLGQIVIYSTKAFDTEGAIDVAIKNMITHPEYVSREVYHDVALLELAETIQFTDNIRPTCLYTEMEDPPDNAKLYVTGWGTINTRTRAVSGILLKAPLKPVPWQQCNISYHDAGLNRRISRGVIPQQMCAYDPEVRKDSCQGDSGGPLQIVVDESLKSYSIVGVVSAGFNCGTTIPGLYTRVAAYLDFIESVVWPLRK